MGMQKHHRQVLQAVRRLCRDIEVQLEPARKHPKLVARYAGLCIRVTVSSSPSCEEDVVRHCVRDVVSRFAARGVALHG